VQARRDHAVLDRQGRLDQGGDAGRRIEVPHVALERAQGARRAGLLENPRQGRDLDRVAQRRARAVGFDQPDRARLDPRQGLRHGDDLGLPLDARHRVAHLQGTVVVDRRAQDHPMKMIAVGHRIGHPPEHHEPEALPLCRSGRRGVEGTAMAVVREDAARLVQVSALARHQQAHAAGQSHVALAVEQALHRQVHRHERRRARRLHGEARTAQAELEGDPRGQEVGAAAQHGLVGAHRAHHLGVVLEVGEQIGVDAGAGKDTDRTGEAAGIVAGVLQRLPGALQQQAVLRIDDLGLAGREPEETGVEELGTVDDGARPDVGRVRQQIGRDAGRPQLRLGEEGDRLDARDEVLPETFDVPGAREPARHADDGNAVR
jgi:hypothetical protein